MSRSSDCFDTGPVDASLLAGNADAGLDLAAPAAGADGAEAEPDQPVTAEQRVVDGAAGDADPDAVERERQARLRRWQQSTYAGPRPKPLSERLP